MNGLVRNWNDVYPENTRKDLDDPKNEEHCDIIQGIKFCTNFAVDSKHYGSDIYTGINIFTKEQFIVFKKIVENHSQADGIYNDLKQSYKIRNQGITCILEIHSHAVKENHVYLFYKFYKYTLRKHCNPITEEFKNNFKYFLKKLFRAVDLLHLEQIAIGNISLDNIAVVNENKKLKLKIFNLAKAKNSSSDDEYTKDKIDVGILVLSIIVDDKEAQAIADKFKQLSTYQEKFNLIHKTVKDIQWIENTNIKNFADLIACLLNVKSCDNLIEFTKHPFFYNRERILEFFSSFNGRLNLSQDERSKDSIKFKDVKNRNKVIKKIMPEDPTIKDKLTELLGVFAPRDASLAERSREARNKEVHLEDDTDSEGEDNRQDCDMKDKTQDNSEIKPLSKKDPEAWRIISKFFRKNGGPINVHLQADENFIYDLFNSARILAFNPNIKKNYIDSFLFENSKNAYDKILEEIELIELESKTEDNASLDNVSKMNKAPAKKTPARSSDDRNDGFRENKKYVDTIKQNSMKKKSHKEAKQEVNPEQQATSQRITRLWHEPFNHSQQHFGYVVQHEVHSQLPATYNQPHPAFGPQYFGYPHHPVAHEYHIAGQSHHPLDYNHQSPGPSQPARRQQSKANMKNYDLFRYNQ